MNIEHKERKELQFCEKGFSAIVYTKDLEEWCRSVSTMGQVQKPQSNAEKTPSNW